jgi:ribosomal protein S18 acetylase RimI-like enzyme
MTIRPATDDDWKRIGDLGELLVRAHHGFNPSRFIHPSSMSGDLYASRVRAEIARGHGTVLVADVDGRVVGFVFAGIEPESWKELRDIAGYVHDLVVDEPARHSGVGTALMASAIAWFDARGVSRVMLWTAPQNVSAQRLFHRLGFRSTMIELTLSRDVAG